MARRNRTAARRGTSDAQPPSVRVRAALAAVSDIFLNATPPQERPWKYLLPILALAFAARAAVALSGDFVMHPDEIMQYLEPAHRLAFGSGAVFWEYHYGARSWLTPGLVAAVLKLFDLAGLGQPVWYVGGVKLMFCAISLLIPAGMYFFARNHFGETTARVALVAGAFWYELVGFAHKPMTEFTAAALLMALLALCVRPDPNRLRVVIAVAFLAVLATAVRLQYAPLALPLLALFFLRTDRKIHLALASAAFIVAVGVFDAVTWDAGLFHSYILNFRVNLELGDLRAGESPPWQFLYWLLLASVGAAALCVLAALRDVRRYALPLALIAVALLAHSLQSHKEYRFIFIVIPLWLLIAADLVTRLALHLNANDRPRSGRRASRRAGRRPPSAPSPWKAALSVAAAVFALISLAGILNALPRQSDVYRAWSAETGVIRFISNHDPTFAAYRYLSEAPDVAAVLHMERYFFNTPGYYYLHREIPMYTYTRDMAFLIFSDPDKTELESLAASVSHVVTGNPEVSIPGYSLEKSFGEVRILRRDAGEPPIRRWQSYTPTFQVGFFGETAAELYPEAPPVPPNHGIRFAGE